MALRAGYYGLKNSVKKKLEKLAADMAGAKVIKTIGDGLNLTNAGKLNVIAATADKLGGVKVGAGLSIQNGALSVENTGYDYSLTEFDTGQKWVDNSEIYAITVSADAPTNNQVLATISNLANIVEIKGVFELIGTDGTYSQTRELPMYFNDSLSFAIHANKNTGEITVYTTNTARFKNVRATVYYTKTQEG